jgi:hypothetical protein
MNNPTQTRQTFASADDPFDSGAFKPIIIIDQYSAMYVYYKALNDRYDISHEVEYMNYQEPEWHENLTEAEALGKIVALQHHRVAEDSELLFQEIKR